MRSCGSCECREAVSAEIELRTLEDVLASFQGVDELGIEPELYGGLGDAVRQVVRWLRMLSSGRRLKHTEGQHHELVLAGAEVDPHGPLARAQRRVASQLQCAAQLLRFHSLGVKSPGVCDGQGGSSVRLACKAMLLPLPFVLTFTSTAVHRMSW